MAAATHRVLVVDDDEDVREALAELLEEEGYLVDRASNGVEALARIKERPPEVMLLDMMMPVMSGEELLRMMHGEGHFPELAIIVISAQKAPPCDIVGARCFVRKPIAFDELSLLVAKCCGAG